MNTPTLKPCPCCGAQAVFGSDDLRRHWVECTGCGLRSEPGRYPSVPEAHVGAASEWNRRTPWPPAHPECVTVADVVYGRLVPKTKSIADIIGAWADDPQSAPVARGPEVFPEVFKLLDRYAKHSGCSVDELRQLVEERKAFGLNKYGVALHRDNGRDSVKDAEDETGDLPGYMVQSLMRGEEEKVRRIKMLLSQVVTIIDLCLSKPDWFESIGGKVEKSL
jgi:hypothetical protein